MSHQFDVMYLYCYPFTVDFICFLQSGGDYYDWCHRNEEKTLELPDFISTVPVPNDLDDPTIVEIDIGKESFNIHRNSGQFLVNIRTSYHYVIVNS